MPEKVKNILSKNLEDKILNFILLLGITYAVIEFPLMFTVAAILYGISKIPFKGIEKAFADDIEKKGITAVAKFWNDVIASVFFNFILPVLLIGGFVWIIVWMISSVPCNG